MVTVVAVWTAIEVTGKVAVDAPEGIVTVAGTVAADVLLDVRVTTNPPLGAVPEMVTVPVEAVPPSTDVGLNVTLVNTDAVTVRFALAEVPFAAVAVIGTVTFDGT